MISSKTLYLTADRENVVEEGDPKAQFLLVRAGLELPDALAEKYGVKGDNKPAQAEEPPQGGPVTQNREEALPPLKKRAKGKK